MSGNLNKLIEIYQPDGYDWMDEAITSDNPLVIYLSKVEDKYYESLITAKSFQTLCTLFNENHDLFEEWQWLFYAINDSQTKPLRAHREMIRELKEETTKSLENIKLTLNM